MAKKRTLTVKTRVKARGLAARRLRVRNKIVLKG